ncbi:MAG: DUF1080 domain-containing protein [Gemmatimonadota bacterium]|nr:DUF1080 domain-containing protein [Gemmatimonadota bacterium]
MPWFSLLLFGIVVTLILRGVLSRDPMQDVTVNQNELTGAEIADGWRLLFDGTSAEQWVGYGRDSFPTRGWDVIDGMLFSEPDDTGGPGFRGDIVTRESYDDFELSLEFRLAERSNSGIFYRAVHREGFALWQVAPEYQVLDDISYVPLEDWPTSKTLTGDNYDLHSSAERVAAPVGEWNAVRIVADGSHVEHWLNGVKTVEYEMWSGDWDSLVAESKFAEYEHYGQSQWGSIGLQDHGGPVWYRNIKIRTLSGESQ